MQIHMKKGAHSSDSSGRSMRVPPTLTPLSDGPMQAGAPQCACWTALSRRRAAALLCAVAGMLTRPLSPNAAAFEVQQRTEQELLERSLYQPPAPTVVPYQQQLSDAITIKSMRGIWSLNEKYQGRSADGTRCNSIRLSRLSLQPGARVGGFGMASDASREHRR